MFGRTYTNSYIIKYLNLTLRSRFNKLYFAQKKKKKKSNKFYI